MLPFFPPTFCVFQDLSSNKLIRLDEVQDGLYHYVPSLSPVLLYMLVTHSFGSNMCHLWLGHPSITHISQLSYSLSNIFSFHSHSDGHYFLNIVDDYSHCTWVFLVRHNSKTYFSHKGFCAKAQTQFQRQVHQIHTDNGIEFLTNIT